MVSVYTNPLPYQDFSHFYSYHMAGDPMKNPGMSGAENCNLIEWNTGPGVEDPNKKVRKPYTITKSRESWSEQEHDKFLEALQLFDRDWKKIEAFVGSKTVIQIRSHAQKYFLKVQKNGTSEHVPPPRPKRKAAHTYPQKAQKTMVAGPSQSSTPLDARCSMRPNPMSVPGNPVIGAPLSPWTYNVLPPTGCTSPVVKDDFGSAGVVMRHNYSSSSNDSTHRIWTSDETNRQVKEQQSKAVRVMPDFAQVYRFIGSVFDPTTTDHLQRLKKMDPIDIETALMMMKNLSINLVSPEFENHQRPLSSYGITF